MSSLDLMALWEQFTFLGGPIFVIVGVLLLCRVLAWAWRTGMSVTSIHGALSFTVTDMDAVRQRRAETVRSRWWHEPTVWDLGFGLFGANAAIFILAGLLAEPPPPHPLLVEHGLTHLDPGPPFSGGDGVMLLVIFGVLSVSFFLDARIRPYTIDNEGIRRKRYFGGEHLLRWEDVVSVELTGDRPVRVTLYWRTPDGKEGVTPVTNGFYNREAFEPVIYRLLGRYTVVEEASPAADTDEHGLTRT